jgi:Cu(I)/Ag(I) efflux system membrane fusion protein
MTRQVAMLAMGLLVATAACGRDPDTQDLGGMTPEEHARMGAGGPAADSGDTRVHVTLTAAQARAIGVTYVTVQRGRLYRQVRTVGQIVPAEPSLTDITPKVDGFVEQLFVDATGVAVRRGQPLLTLYSPMLVTAQQELLTARQLAASIDSSDAESWRNAQALLAAARRRLAWWDVPAEQVERLERTGTVTKTLTLTAPFDGVVLEKMVVAGQGVMPGMKLYRLADLATVWVEGEVFEQDLAAVRLGTPARVEIAATLYVDVRLGADALSLPSDAIVMTGERNLVFVARADGTLEARPVTLGARAGDRVQVLDGVMAGERVAASANFLIDAESRLGTGKSMDGMPGMQP